MSVLMLIMILEVVMPTMMILMITIALLPVNDGVTVQIFQRQCNLRNIDDRHVFLKISVDHKKGFDITSNHILHHLKTSNV